MGVWEEVTVGDILIKAASYGQTTVCFYDEGTDDFLWKSRMYSLPQVDEEVSHKDDPDSWWKVNKVAWQFDNTPSPTSPPESPNPATEYAQFGVAIYVTEIE